MKAGGRSQNPYLGLEEVDGVGQRELSPLFMPVQNIFGGSNIKGRGSQSLSPENFSGNCLDLCERMWGSQGGEKLAS